MDIKGKDNLEALEGVYNDARMTGSGFLLCTMQGISRGGLGRLGGDEVQLSRIEPALVKISEPWEKRMETEKSELDIKIEKLRVFMWSQNMSFQMLPLVEKDFLFIQLHVMRQYSEILGRRIAWANKGYMD